MLRRLSRCRDSSSCVVPSSFPRRLNILSNTPRSSVNHAPESISCIHIGDPERNVDNVGQTDNVKYRNVQYSHDQFAKVSKAIRADLHGLFEASSRRSFESRHADALQTVQSLIKILDSESDLQRQIIERFLEQVPADHRFRVLSKWTKLKNMAFDLKGKMDTHENFLGSLRVRMKRNERELAVAVVTGSRFLYTEHEDYAIGEAERRLEDLQKAISAFYQMKTQSQGEFLKEATAKVTERRGYIDDLTNELKSAVKAQGAQSTKLGNLVAEFSSNRFDILERKLSSMGTPAGRFSAKHDALMEQMYSQTKSLLFNSDAMSVDQDAEHTGMPDNTIESTFHTSYSASPRTFAERMVFPDVSIVRSAYSIYTQTVKKRTTSQPADTDEFWLSPSDLVARGYSTVPSLLALDRLQDFLRPRTFHQWSRAKEHQQQWDEILETWAKFEGAGRKWAADLYPLNHTIKAGGMHDELISRPNTFAVYTDGGLFHRRANLKDDCLYWIDVGAAAILPSHCTILSSVVITLGEPIKRGSDAAELLGVTQGLEAATQLAVSGQHIALFTDFPSNRNPHTEYGKEPTHQDPLFLTLYDKLLACLEMAAQKGVTAGLYWLPKKYALIPNRLAHAGATFMGRKAMPAEYLEDSLWRDGLIRQTFRNAKAGSYLSDVG